MCNIDQHITLGESDCAQITWCKGCKTFSLSYNSCCASFTPTELNQFSKVLLNLRKQDFSCKVLGRNCAIVRNSNALIGFCLTKEDTEALLDLITQANTLYDAFKVIYH